MNKRQYKTLNDLPDILTVSHIKEYLDIGQNVAYQLINSGEIESFNIGRLKKIHKQSLIKYLEKHNLNVG